MLNALKGYPESPCVKKCKLSTEARQCEGCGRSIEEIQLWRSMTAAQQWAVCLRLRGDLPSRGFLSSPLAEESLRE